MLTAQPLLGPDDSKRPLPRLRNRKLGTESLATKMSTRPSPARSRATTPKALALGWSMPASRLTSVKVRSPLLRYRTHEVAWKAVGAQLSRRPLLSLHSG